MKEAFHPLNTYYEKIYVLSVKAAEERRQLFAKRFAGMEYEFFYGADKNEFTIDGLKEKGIYDEKLTKQHHRFSKTMLPGEIACAWSHRMIYEDMLKNGFDRILIFEDDAVPDEKRIQDIPPILAEIPADTALFYWGWGKNGEAGFRGGIKKAFYHIQHAAGFLKWDHRMIRNLYAKKYSAYIRSAGFHDFTYAYAISRAGAEKLISMQTPLQYIADNLLAHAAAHEILHAYIAYPMIFLHDEAGADHSFIR